MKRNEEEKRNERKTGRPRNRCMCLVFMSYLRPQDEVCIIDALDPCLFDNMFFGQISSESIQDLEKPFPVVASNSSLEVSLQTMPLVFPGSKEVMKKIYREKRGRK